MFLQQAMLAALPLALLPVIIHLIHQQRHRTVKWAAMMFLKDAKRMHQGMARVRQILILTMRVLAVLGVVLMVSRPLASGWFGVALGGGADTSIVLLDRSASMEESDPRSGETKRATALRKMVELAERTGQNRLVLIDSARMEPAEIPRPSALLDLPETGATATHADIPSLVQRAFEFIRANRSGQTDIWVLSDLRKGDWDPDGGRWEALRDAAKGMDSVRVHLLTYPELTGGNLAVEVLSARRRERSGGNAELLLDLRVRRTDLATEAVKLPLGVVVNGVRTVIQTELVGEELKLQGQVIPLDAETEQGWGRVELPGDGNLLDNEAYFVFSEPAPRHTVVVSEERAFLDSVLSAVEVGPERNLAFTAEALDPGKALDIPWDTTSLVVWQTALPSEGSAEKAQILEYLDRGGAMICFPPRGKSEEVFEGFGWRDWQTRPQPEEGEAMVDWWRPDSDLFQNTKSGRAIPLGELTAVRTRSLEGEGNVLARFGDLSPMMVRSPRARGALYFCTILPQPGESSLAQDGIAFYVALHRALEGGAQSLALARQAEVGKDQLPGEGWGRVAPDRVVFPGEQALQAGVFERGSQLWALNRPLQEDRSGVMTRDEVQQIWDGWRMTFLQDEAGGQTSLASEIWRAFLVMVSLALLLEALLCLPQPKREPRNSSVNAPPSSS